MLKARSRPRGLRMQPGLRRNDTEGWANAEPPVTSPLVGEAGRGEPP